MAFSYYRAPDAPAPDWGALVHAKLGAREQKQGAINALLQLAEENQKLKAAKEQHAAALSQEQATLAENTRYHNAEIKDRQTALDAASKAEEDRAASADASRESNAQMRLMAEAGRMLRQHLDEQGRMERAQQEHQIQMQREEDARQQRVQQLQHAASITTGHLNAMEDINAAKRNPDLFETHTFSALEASPYYSPDPSVMKKALSNTGMLQGKSADEVYDQLAKTKVDIPIAKDPNWFTSILQKHHGQTAPDGTPTENLDESSIEHLQQYAFGKDKTPFANSLSQAQEMAGNFFKQSKEVGPLFSGSKTEAQLPMPKADANSRITSGLDKARYSANMKQIGDLTLASGASNVKDDERAGYKARIDELTKENDAIYSKYGASGTPAPAPKTGTDLNKELDDLLGPTEPPK